MRLGLQITSFMWPGPIAPKLAEIARAADDAGFASLWVMDHFFQMDDFAPVDDAMLEAYSTLTYLAAHTRRVRLGALVTGVIYRYPGLLVKTVTTLDVLSGGRAYFGIGAAWYEREARGLGVPFPETMVRFEQLEETLQITQRMWSGDTQPFNGKHYQLAEPLNRPQPISQPHPPIMVGGMGERVTLRLVAQYADACNLFDYVPTSELRRKLDVLKRHCDDLGRDYDHIEKTSLGTIHLAPGKMTPTEVIARCHELADAGIQQAIFSLPNDHEIAPIETFAREIIPAVAAF